MPVETVYKAGGFKRMSKWMIDFGSEEKKKAFLDREFAQAIVTQFSDGQYDVTPAEMENGRRRYKLQVANKEGTLVITRNPNARRSLAFVIANTFESWVGLPSTRFIRITPRRKYSISQKGKTYKIVSHYYDRDHERDVVRPYFPAEGLVPTV